MKPRAVAALLAAAAVVVAPASGYTRTKPNPPSERLSIEVQGHHRDYYLHIPEGSRAAPWPLVLVLHGEGGNAPAALSRQRWIEASDRYGFLLVGLEAQAARSWLPQGSGLNPRIWNDGDPANPEAITRSDDVGYTKAVLDELKRRFTIEAAHTYAAGFSGGGAMTQRLAVELGGEFAAIASASARRFGTQAPRVPLSVMLIYGRLDPQLPAAGGGSLRPVAGTPEPSSSAVIASWIRDLHCAGESQPESPNPRVERQTWPACDGGAEVQAVNVADLGHHWGGGLPDPAGSAAGPASDAFDSTGEIWNFFVRHPRAAAPHP
ncbi:MAG: PHB depolymerase family esterase [Nevskia sp.]|nr:PHB depolymerase family esterase [Nevskia sp.]